MSAPPNNRAFSLLELLAVLALGGILFVLLAPSMQSIGGGTHLTSAADLTVSQLRLARQLAVSRNRNTELRLLTYRDESGTVRVRSMAIYLQGEEAGEPALPVGRPHPLPSSVTLDDGGALSPLLQEIDIRNGADLEARLPSVGLDYSASIIRFRPDGSAEVPSDNSRNFFTLRPATHEVSSPGLPSNYAVVQIFSQNGQIRLYRP